MMKPEDSLFLVKVSPLELPETLGAQEDQNPGTKMKSSNFFLVERAIDLRFGQEVDKGV